MSRRRDIRIISYILGEEYAKVGAAALVSLSDGRGASNIIQGDEETAMAQAVGLLAEIIVEAADNESDAFQLMLHARRDLTRKTQEKARRRDWNGSKNEEE